MKKHKKLEYHEPKDGLTNRDKFEMGVLMLISCFIAAAVIAFIIASLQAITK